MKEFFKTRSYDMVRMFLNQFATSIFGLVLALAAGKAQNPTLRNVTSVAAILFYLFLLYTMTWDLGFKDKVSVESGRKKRVALTGFWISLCANIPNLIFAVLISLAVLFDVPALSSIGAFATTAALLLTLESVFGTLFSVAFYHEHLEPRVIVGFALILVAILISETKLKFLRRRTA